MTPDIERALSRRDRTPDAWMRLEHMWTASVSALRGYRPAAGFHGSATFITPTRVTDGLAQCAEWWRAYCPALRVVRTSGNHLSMVRAPHASKTARAIRNLFSASDLEVL
jgi:thioesterase domain-containing protein